MSDIDDIADRVVRAQWEAAQRGALSMWTIYHRPKDWPQGYIARRYETSKGGTTATSLTLGGGEDALPMLREVFMRAALHCMNRHPDDEPAIVETWM